MKKRAVGAFVLFCIILSSLCVRLYSLGTRTDAAEHIQTHSKKITLDYLRLPLIDCRGQLLCNCETESYAAARPVYDSLSVLRVLLSEEDFLIAARSVAAGTPAYAKTEKYAEDENIVILKKFIRYGENSSLVHLAGYIDADGNGAAGIERAFNSYLKTDVTLYAGFSCGADGRAIAGAEIETEPLYNESAGGVKLTVDVRIQKIVENALKNGNIKKGAALVCKTKTGEIKAMASVPVYNQNDVGASLSDKNSPLLNRALSAYPVGSVFKAVVAAAALENGISADFSVKCTGSVTVDGKVFHCSNQTAHGVVDMQRALNCSCNCYFIKLAQKIGCRPILETAGVLGYGSIAEIAMDITAAGGNVPTAEELRSSGQLALFSFGQGSLTATAIQIANTFSAIGGGGIYTEPYAVISAADAEGRTVYKFQPKPPIRAFSEETADVLREMLKNVVKEGTAEKACTALFESAGKTATAQTGTYNSNKTEKLCTWFGGFFPAEGPEYTVVILKEDGTTGGEDCAPVFKEIAEKIYSLNLR